MAAISDADRAAVRTDLARLWSSEAKIEVPLNKFKVRKLIDLIDDQLSIAEASTLAAIPAGPGRDWLLANKSIARYIMAAVEKKRAEVL